MNQDDMDWDVVAEAVRDAIDNAEGRAPGAAMLKAFFRDHELVVDYEPLKIGMQVMYRGSWGRDTAVPCTITGIGEKDGRPAFDNSLQHWGYREQYDIVREVK